MDALLLSMAASVTAGVPRSLAAHAIGLGIIANGLLKLTLALVVGTPRFRLRAALGLGLLAAASTLCLAAATARTRIWSG